MKQLALTFCLAFLLIACKKQDSLDNFQDDQAIENPYGTWKFLAKEDRTTNTVYYKDQQVADFCAAGSNSCDIILNFTRINNTDVIIGNTITNDVSGTFTFNGPLRRMKITGFGGTKVGEPAWAYHIWDNMYLIQNFEVNSSFLKLYFDNGQQRLIFQRQ